MQPNSRYDKTHSPLFRLKSKRKLAEILKLTPERLRSLSKGENLYDEWDVPKRSGATRHIEHPKPALKRVQASVASLLSRIAPPHFLMCPVKGRSFVDNANRHATGKEVRSLDVKDYFASTRSRRVYWFFHQRMECSPDVAGVLTSLCTHKGHLPTGSPVSPILSYFAHIDIWEEVERIALAARCVLSVYIDDVNVSGDRVPNHVLWEMKKAIHGGGLRYHKEKRFRGRIKEVTGVIIDDGRLKAPNRIHLSAHQTRTALSKAMPDADRARALARLRGQEGVIRQIESPAE